VEVRAPRPQALSYGEGVVEDFSLLDHEFAGPVRQFFEPGVGRGVTLSKFLAVLRPEVLADWDDVVRGDDRHIGGVLAR
jgi:hypothetical protein